MARTSKLAPQLTKQKDKPVSIWADTDSILSITDSSSAEDSSDSHTKFKKKNNQIFTELENWRGIPVFQSKRAHSDSFVNAVGKGNAKRQRVRSVHDKANNNPRKKRKCIETDDECDLNFNKAINFLTQFNGQCEKLKKKNAELIKEKNGFLKQQKEESDKLKNKHMKEVNELNTRLNYYINARAREAILKQSCMKKNDILRKKYSDMENERDHLRSDLDLYEGKSEKLNAMDMKQLNGLEAKLHKSLKNIQDLKERLNECIICKDNRKNVIFVGCGHCVLCDECEHEMNDKKCPRCGEAYTLAQKLAL